MSDEIKLSPAQLDALREIGADVAYLGQPGFPPLAIGPAGIHGAGGDVSVRVRGDVSSQFLTGLLSTFDAAQKGVVDLQGKTLIPGFIDAHGHVFNTGIQALSANLLAPPDGTVTGIADLQQALRNWVAKPQNKAHGIILGFGYDDSQLKEKRHPTRQELDVVSQALPVIIIHQSGHLATLNSKALALAGFGVFFLGIHLLQNAFTGVSAYIDFNQFGTGTQKLEEHLREAVAEYLADRGLRVFAAGDAQTRRD